MILHPRLQIIGHCTSHSAKITAIFQEDNLPKNLYTQLFYKLGNTILYEKSEIIKISTSNNSGIVTFSVDIENVTKEDRTVDYFTLAAVSKNEITDYDIDLNLVVSATFRLFPKDRPLRLALVSCNKYDDIDLRYRFNLWKALKEKIDSEDIDLIVHAGDQIYADKIKNNVYKHKRGRKTILKEEDEILNEYRDLYISHWSPEEISDVLATCPNLMMWDDHEIYDGWGSHDDDKNSKSGKLLFKTAKIAFEEFQAIHNPPPFKRSNSFTSGFIHEDHAFLLIDGRSNRDYTAGRILSKQDFANIERFLDKCSNKQVRHLYIITGVPIFYTNTDFVIEYLEQFLFSLKDDMRDSWISPNNRQDAERLLLMCFDLQLKSPSTQVSILSGDIHVSALGHIVSNLPAHLISGTNYPMRINQITSSGIGSQPPDGINLFIISRHVKGEYDILDDTFTGLLKTLKVSDGNSRILARRNFAIISCSDQSRKDYDPHNNIWVEYYYEDKNKRKGYSTFEQRLFGLRQKSS